MQTCSSAAHSSHCPCPKLIAHKEDHYICWSIVVKLFQDECLDESVIIIDSTCIYMHTILHYGSLELCKVTDICFLLGSTSVTIKA
jgi:hypothetical protein